MTCDAQKYNDGSWYCVTCKVRGDADEPTDLYCKQNVNKAQHDLDKELYGDRPSRDNKKRRDHR